MAVPTRVFWFPDMAVTADDAGRTEDRPLWLIRVEARGPYTEFRTRWVSPPTAFPTLAQIRAAEDVVEGLYMALVPDDFMEGAEGRLADERERWIRGAAEFGPERLTRAYGEVMRRRDRRERYLRRPRTGPKEWFPRGD